MNYLPVAPDTLYWRDEMDAIEPGQRRFYDGSLRLEHIAGSGDGDVLPAFMVVYPDLCRELFNYSGTKSGRTRAISRAANAIAAWVRVYGEGEKRYA